MHRTIYYNVLAIILLAIIFTSCNSANKNNNEQNMGKNSSKSISVIDTTPRVTGIGGIFFASQNPQETREWYGKNLGLAIDDYGSVFEFRNANHPDEINYLRWSAFEKGDEYFKPSQKEFMINYRVQNLEGFVTQLMRKGVTIIDSIAIYSYGKFIHIMDNDGNKIELWEPVDSVLTQMGGKTTK